MRRCNFLRVESKPSLSLVVFRLVRPGHQITVAESNTLNAEYQRRLAVGAGNEGKGGGEDTATYDPLYLTSAELGGDLCLRFAVGAEGTQASHIMDAQKTLIFTAMRLLKEMKMSDARNNVLSQISSRL